MCKLYTVVDCAIAAYMNLRKTGCLVLETYTTDIALLRSFFYYRLLTVFDVHVLSGSSVSLI